MFITIKLLGCVKSEQNRNPICKRKSGCNPFVFESAHIPVEEKKNSEDLILLTYQHAVVKEINWHHLGFQWQKHFGCCWWSMKFSKIRNRTYLKASRRQNLITITVVRNYKIVHDWAACSILTYRRDDRRNERCKKAKEVIGKMVHKVTNWN